MNKIVEEKNIVIIIEDGFQKKPFDCSVCKLSLKDVEDVRSYDFCKACKDCQDFFYWPNKSLWDSGWRPKKEEVHQKLNNYYMIKEK